ncbi:uncharacterized protein LOC131237482 [Magnolia sinica]|uniref:uncharacterized protein LOC131237482 n=1 Tax=Magnolia sinica TaxID=86752 RepID=UPI002657BBDD|nr:uncharacterized protein LOC131237482 [Magnolia sinica]XP_058091257.1 uncharacterized protein LOC131237482 [Magnolia sinica]
MRSSQRFYKEPSSAWNAVLSSGTSNNNSNTLSEQQLLRLNPAKVYDVIAAVCSETSSLHANLMTMSSRLTNRSGKPFVDVAVNVLIKLVIDILIGKAISWMLNHGFCRSMALSTKYNSLPNESSQPFETMIEMNLWN